MIPPTEGVDRTFVCLHGIGGASSDWSAVRPRLARFGEVLCLDVPVGSLESMRDEILAGLPRAAGAVVLVGHSRGGVLALMVAAERPESVDALILSGGYVPPTRADRPWIVGIGSWIKHRVRLAGQFVRAGHLTAAQPDRAASLRTSLPAVLQMAGVGLRPAAYDAIARAVRCPVLAISGEYDSHVPASWVGAAARRYGWSLASISAGSHFAHVDQPDDWSAAVERWLAG